MRILSAKEIVRDEGEDSRAVLEDDARIGLIVVCVAILVAGSQTGFDTILATSGFCK